MQRYLCCIRGGSKLVALLFVLSLAHLAMATGTAPCCLYIPPYPGNEADAHVRVTYGDPPGVGLPPEYSYFTVDILPGGAGIPTPPIPPKRYAAWCFDSETGISTGTGTNYGGRLYSTCDPTLDFNKHLPPHPGVIADAATWKRINYLINHRMAPCGAGPAPTMWEVQMAIFKIFGQPLPPVPPYPGFRPEVVTCLVNDATANAPAWQPKVGDKIAVIFNIEVNWDQGVPDVQLIFLEVPCTPLPDCKVSVSVECQVPPPPPSTAFDCSGAKPIDTLWVRWNGDESKVWVKAWNGAVNTGVSQSLTVEKGKILEFKRSGTFPNDVYFEIYSDAAMTNRVGLSTFHLSCSDDDMDGPEDCGKAAGNGKTTLATYVNKWVFEGMAGNGKTLGCTVPPTNPSTNCVVIPKPLASCESLGKPTSLTFKFTGGGCAASTNPQSGKFICSGTVKPDAPVLIGTPHPYTLSTHIVSPGGTFTVSASSFSSQSMFTLNSLGQNGGTESLSIHTSCSQPLAVGDVFGSLTLVGFNGQVGGNPVTLIYTVKNDGPQLLKNVYLYDYKVSSKELVPPFDLAPGQEKKVMVEVELTQTSTFQANVYADVPGAICAKASNEVVVEVKGNCPTTVSPAVSFACSDVKPIDSISMVWNGTQTVDVVAWKGPANASLKLATLYGVPVGAAVTVAGYAGAPNDVYWEVFAAGTTTKLGESTFHLSCSDDDMNGPDDCGKPQGDGKGRVGYLNTWLFAGMSGNGNVVSCGGAQPLPKAAIKDKKLLWTLENTGSSPVTLTGLTVKWPASNGQLMKVKFDGDVIWDDKAAPGATPLVLSTSALTSDSKKKSIAPGDTRVFTLEFEKNAAPNLGDYSLSLLFGSCKLDL